MKKIVSLLLAAMIAVLACIAYATDSWTCYCGKKNYANFCTDCGLSKEESAAKIETERIEKEKEARKAPFRTVENIVEFGHYPQTAEGDDNTPIEWIVLDVQDNKALLISRYGLDAKPYNTEYVDVTWETCTLRTWLNEEFLNTAFSTAEQEAILLTNVDNSSSQCYSGWDTTGGNNTQDKVFLLSYVEANKYFNVQYWKIDGATDNIKSRIAPTAYAIARGTYMSSDYKTADGKAAGWWWLRSPGYGRSIAAHVLTDGSLSSSRVNYDGVIVRPALWLNLESDIF